MVCSFLFQWNKSQWACLPDSSKEEDLGKDPRKYGKGRLALPAPPRLVAPPRPAPVTPATPAAAPATAPFAGVLRIVSVVVFDLESGVDGGRGVGDHGQRGVLGAHDRGIGRSRVGGQASDWDRSGGGGQGGNGDNGELLEQHFLMWCLG